MLVHVQRAGRFASRSLMRGQVIELPDRVARDLVRSGAVVAAPGGSVQGEVISPGSTLPARRRDRLRVLADVHGYPPKHLAGAELMLATILRELASRGHECRVLAPIHRAKAGERDGVRVEIVPRGRGRDEPYGWADLVITHLDETAEVIGWARKADAPLVHLIHNDRQLVHWRVRQRDAALVVFNSVWLQRAVRWRGRQIVCRPPVFVGDYRVQGGGDAITLVNLNPSKGGDVFALVAQMMPERRFLGVKGSYGIQVMVDLPNVEIWDLRQDMRDVYAETRLLLMPSAYESWGRVAIEAACSGIPTIAAPMPGLRESLGEAGIFVERDDPTAWAEAIRALDEEQTYSQASAAARGRARELEEQVRGDLNRLEAELRQIAGLVEVVA